jgi:hypothetical protein
MSDDYQRIELITGTARRRRWTTEQKLRIIEASCEPGESVSSVARFAIISRAAPVLAEAAVEAAAVVAPSAASYWKHSAWNC